MQHLWATGRGWVICLTPWSGRELKRDYEGTGRSHGEGATRELRKDYERTKRGAFFAISAAGLE
jgi:hypothetical protein